MARLLRRAGLYGPELSLAEAGVLGVRERIAASLDEPAHALHPGGDEHVALARLDRVEAIRVVCSDDEQYRLPSCRARV